MPKLKFVVIIGGGLLLSPDLQEKAYSAKIESPSLHFIGMKYGGYVQNYIHPRYLMKCQKREFNLTEGIFLQVEKLTSG